MSKTEEEKPAIPATIIEGKDRITFRLDAYFEHSGDEPRQVSSAVYKLSDPTDLEPYSRRVIVGNQFQPLDLGWFQTHPDKIGLIIIESLEGRGQYVNPTKEEKEAIDNAEVIVSFNDSGENHCRIWSGWPFVFRPDNPHGVMVRVVGIKETKIRVHIVPHLAVKDG